MKFKEIKDIPFLTVVHIKTKEEAKAIYDRLSSISLYHHELIMKAYESYGERTCYEIHSGCYGSVECYQELGYHIIKFSDLLLPDDMTAIQILKWLQKNKNSETMRKVFETSNISYDFELNYIMETYTPEQIYQKITEYEFEKKKEG